jgi:NAD(P)-dependent dehydrogenase (short-subunit alcohol dehydrogenase family)
MPSGHLGFDDDVVIVTGAGRGLGRSHAEQFAARGARVVLNDIDLDVAKEAVAEIVAAGGTAIADNNNIATAEGAAALVEHALDEFGTLTVVVNNAGIINYHKLEDITPQLWSDMVSVTLNGAYYVTRAAWPTFLANNYGRVVNTTSNAGFAGNETLVHYGAAKLGIAGFTKALSQEVAGTGIHVNAIAPMAVTRMNRDAFFGGKESASEDWREDLKSGRVPMGPPSAVSPTVLWLAHRDTQVNGDIYSTSSGKVSRVGFVVGEGYFNPNYTPEDLRDNLATVRSLGNYLDPVQGTGDELALIPPLFQ